MCVYIHSQAVCDENANCTESTPTRENATTYACKCKPGFSGNGISCSSVRVDHCLRDPCDSISNSRCINTLQSFRCICNPGFTEGYTRVYKGLEDHGLVCIDSKHCRNCGVNADCTKVEDRGWWIFCKCKPGYRPAHYTSRTNGQTYGISPHSTGLCPLPGLLPKKIGFE